MTHEQMLIYLIEQNAALSILLINHSFLAAESDSCSSVYLLHYIFKIGGLAAFVYI